MARKIRMGMIGGGPGAFIGEVHRKAARLDGQIELVAGAFSIIPEESTQMGKELGIDPKRAYLTAEDMLKGELALPADQRVDFVAICTPNFTHFPLARDFAEAGFHIMCEKPMTISLEEAKQLEEVVKRKGTVFGLMHAYTAYPMVKLARDLAAKGELGTIRKVIVEYVQEWLSQPVERKGNMQASWREDPKKSGAGCLGDIGTHAANLAEYITGAQIQEVLGEVSTFVEGRPVDDDINVLLHFNKGVRGILQACQVAVGEGNDLAIWVYGDKASIEWHQQDPNYLYFRPYSSPEQLMVRGSAYIAQKSPAAARASRIPAGHPEGYIEAFANHYVNFAEQIRAKIEGKKPDPFALDLPSITEGVRGMAFIDAVLRSGRTGNVWVKMPV